MYAIRILIRQPVRSVLTVGGIALCIVLMLFLLGVYRGVADGSVDYIRSNPADLWVLQRNATNILRGSSLLTLSHGTLLRETGGVRQASPVLLFLTTVWRGKENATLFLAGFDPATGAGGPPEIVKGRSVSNDDEMVLDRSFAAKYGIRVGDVVRVQDDSLRVTGLSAGTNAFVIQYGFVTLRRAQSLLGFPSIVSLYLVNVLPGAACDSVRHAILDDVPGVEVYDHETFLRNNIREMESGFMPILYAIAFIGAVVLTSILTLLLTVIILESRHDFAVMRALGSPESFLSGVVHAQACMLSIGGITIALVVFPVLTAAIELIAPEVSTKGSFLQVGEVSLVVLGITLFSAWLAVRRLRSIYPLEAFA
ncbi:MAG TPA: ABC transporter permease [Bacteroidota bacterium]